ncbi:MAG TPA: hypothetical protein VL197_15850 [Nitrospirota bacterium]|nr:hypothetical protein [Nitrospirota bacterium]
MKIGILITARLGSTRLQNKHLLPVREQPILHYLLARIRMEFADEMRSGRVQLIIATSNEPENQEFERFSAEGAVVHYGCKNNIPLRHLETARAHLLDAIIAVDGDDILCSVEGMRAVYQRLLQGSSYVRTTGLPFGMNSMGYTTIFLGTSLEGHLDDTLETGWGRIFDSRKLTDIEIAFPVQDSALRFTLDYPEDLQFFSSVIDSLGDAAYTEHDSGIVNIVLEKKLFLINHVITKQYWDNFYRLQEEEQKGSPAGNPVKGKSS